MHIHILGICGTFMGGLAALAREAGHRVTGCDAGVYPPMSDQLRALGIELIEGFGADQMAKDLALYREALAAAGTAGGIGREVAELWQQALAALGGADHTRVFEFLATKNSAR